MLCSKQPCDRKAIARGWCTLHYMRAYSRREKDGEFYSGPTRGKRKNGSGCTRNGYSYISRDGMQVAEHRWVMEQHLGRPLSSDESVHHKNGNRLDNRIPNLELRTRYHGPGQSVEDLVNYAVEILTRYAPGRLA